MPLHRLSRLRLVLIPIVPLSLLVVRAHLLWAQETPSAGKTPFPSASLAAPFATVPEARADFHPAYENSSLNVKPNPAQTPSLARFGSLDLGHQPSLTKDEALPNLWYAAKTDIGETQVNANHSIGHNPSEWFTHVNPQSMVHFGAPNLNDTLQYYGHRVPWAGQIILGIGKQAESHPRIVHIFDLVKPGLSLGKSSPPRWISK